MKVTVSLSAGKKKYTEDVTEDVSQYANPLFYRELKNIKSSELEQFNGADLSHFIFGWFEAFAQSNDIPQWLYESETILINVEHHND